MDEGLEVLCEGDWPVLAKLFLRTFKSTRDQPVDFQGAQGVQKIKIHQPGLPVSG